MFSTIQFILTVSSIIVLLFSCTPKLTSSKSQNFVRDMFLEKDTIYVTIDFTMDTTKTEQKLSDSVTNIYLKAASKGEHYQSIPTTYNKYTGYNLGTYRLNSDTQVQFVRFEPKYNDYSALYLFQKNSKQKITQPIELAFAFWEEGAQGTGSCLLVRNGTQTDIYIKQYWVNYVGSDAEIMTIADDIILYHMYPSSFNSLVLDSAQYQKWNNIFEHKRW